jgi:PleD family two-component response regulator
MKKKRFLHRKNQARLRYAKIEVFLANFNMIDFELFDQGSSFSPTKKNIIKKSKQSLFGFKQLTKVSSCKNKALIVNDSQIQLMVLSQILEKFDFITDTAENG